MAGKLWRKLQGCFQPPQLFQKILSLQQRSDCAAKLWIRTLVGTHPGTSTTTNSRGIEFDEVGPGQEKSEVRSNDGVCCPEQRDAVEGRMLYFCCEVDGPARAHVPHPPFVVQVPALALQHLLFHAAKFIQQRACGGLVALQRWCAGDVDVELCGRRERRQVHPAGRVCEAAVGSHLQGTCRHQHDAGGARSEGQRI
eukprot:33629-Rhodomonas_salina.2